MEFPCKYCGQRFETDWYPSDQDYDGVRFRASLCERCAAFYFIEATSHPRIFLSKKFSKREYLSEPINRDWSTMPPQWTKSSVQYRKGRVS